MSYAIALSKVAELMQKTQQLESENAALRQQLEDVKRVRYSLKDAVKRAHDEAQACWEDKERMDWLESESVSEPIYSDNRRRRTILFFTGKPVLGEADTLRAAIDAARAKEAKP